MENKEELLKRYKEALERIGLNRNEAKVYLELLNLGLIYYDVF
jgi:sugar-specific transcriptional regulator TrmB